MNLIFHHQKLGITNSLYAIINDIDVHTANPGLEILKQEALQKVLNYSEELVDNNETTIGYREILKEFGQENLTPAGQNLVKLIRTRNKFPSINTAVDAYNISAAESFLAIGAHDIDKIAGDIIFDYAKAGEKIPAVNMVDEFLVNEGDYVYRDGEKILAWLDVKDTDLAKITKQTKNLLLMVEGNRRTSKDYISKYLTEACDRIVQFCGGSYTIKELA